MSAAAPACCGVGSRESACDARGIETRRASRAGRVEGWVLCDDSADWMTCQEGCKAVSECGAPW